MQTTRQGGLFRCCSTSCRRCDASQVLQKPGREQPGVHQGSEAACPNSQLSARRTGAASHMDSHLTGQDRPSESAGMGNTPGCTWLPWRRGWAGACAPATSKTSKMSKDRRLVVTSKRLLCGVASGRWLSFPYSQVSEFFPEIHEWSVTLGFAGSTWPLRLTGPAAPGIALWIAHGVLGPRWVQDPRLQQLQ